MIIVDAAKHMADDRFDRQGYVVIYGGLSGGRYGVGEPAPRIATIDIGGERA